MEEKREERKKLEDSREETLGPGTWVGTIHDDWLGEIVQFGPKRVRIRTFGTDKVTQTTRHGLKDFIALPHASEEWGRRANCYQVDALQAINVAMDAVPGQALAVAEEKAPSFEYLSVSRLNLYMKCPRAYAFRYLENEKIIPAGVMMLGWTIHDAVEHNLAQKIESHEDLAEQLVLDHFSTSYDFESNKCLWEEKLKPGPTKDVGIAMLKLHHSTVAPTIQPVMVEEEFNMLLRNRDWFFKGRIDTMTIEQLLVELKTTGRKPRIISFSHRLQIIAYMVALLSAGQLTHKTRVDYLLRHKNPEKVDILQFDYSPTQGDMRMFLNLTTNVAKGIEGEVFPVNRSHMLCSRKWCGYWELCEHAEGGTVDL